MSMIDHQQPGSTAYTKITSVLCQYAWYTDFLAGKIDSSEYLTKLLEFEHELYRAGLNEDQIHLSSRFSLNDESTVDQILLDLYAKQMISFIDYPKEAFKVLARQVEQDFMHGSYTTYIFPEEARLLYALTHIVQPKTMLFLGSYYGYWAIWAAAVLTKTGGTAYFIDIDSSVLELAMLNMEKFNLRSVVKFVNEDGITYLQREKIPHDFIVVDPEGPKRGDDPDLLDKAIYYPMVKAAHPYLENKGMILCHNILLNHPVNEDDYFTKKIAYNHSQFYKFLPFMQKNYQARCCYDTTEGVGIFAKKV